MKIIRIIPLTLICLLSTFTFSQTYNPPAYDGTLAPEWSEKVFPKGSGSVFFDSVSSTSQYTLRQVNSELSRGETGGLIFITSVYKYYLTDHRVDSSSLISEDTLDLASFFSSFDSKGKSKKEVVKSVSGFGARDHSIRTWTKKKVQYAEFDFLNEDSTTSTHPLFTLNTLKKANIALNITFTKSEDKSLLAIMGRSYISGESEYLLKVAFFDSTGKFIGTNELRLPYDGRFMHRSEVILTNKGDLLIFMKVSNEDLTELTLAKINTKNSSYYTFDKVNKAINYDNESNSGKSSGSLKYATYILNESQDKLMIIGSLDISVELEEKMYTLLIDVQDPENYNFNKLSINTEFEDVNLESSSSPYVVELTNHDTTSTDIYVEMKGYDDARYLYKVDWSGEMTLVYTLMPCMYVVYDINKTTTILVNQFLRRAEKEYVDGRWVTKKQAKYAAYLVVFNADGGKTYSIPEDVLIKDCTLKSLHITDESYLFVAQHEKYARIGAIKKSDLE